MLEVGVVNVLGTLRTDTLYDPTDTRIAGAAECQRDPTLPCIEVKLELSSRWTRGTGVLQPRPYGTEPMPDHRDGAAITDGNTYAPQMLWEMSHYCDAFFTTGDSQDPVCYADYFGPFNNGFNALGLSSTAWPRSNQAWSVFPNNNIGQNHC